MPTLLWIKRAVFLFVLIGLLSAAHQAAERWRSETSALSAQVQALQEQAAAESDADRARELSGLADRREASLPALANVRWDLAGWACLVYALGLLPPGLVLHRCLRAFSVPCSFRRAVAAQLLGHAGKYIPGKAMVVVLRVGAILPSVSMTANQGRWFPDWWRSTRGHRRQSVIFATDSTKREPPEESSGRHTTGRPIGRVSTCVFFETLLMMGVGGGVAGVLLWNSPLPAWVRVFAAAMAVGSLLPVCPPVLRRVIDFVAARRQFKRQQQSNDNNNRSKNSNDRSSNADTETPTVSSSPITWRLLGGCYIVSLGSWICIGLSFALLVAAIPSFERLPPVVDLVPLATAAISLGMVLGFASLLPGGAGVREYVTLLVLTPVIGQTHALLAVIAARLMFILVEAGLASLSALYLHSIAPSSHG